MTEHKLTRTAPFCEVVITVSPSGANTQLSTPSPPALESALQRTTRGYVAAMKIITRQGI